MAAQEVKVFVAVPTFLSAIHTAMCEHLKKLLGPEEIIVRSVTDDAGVQKQRLMLALAQVNPTAMIAMSIHPDQTTVAAFKSANVPMVLIDEEAPGVSTIAIDNVAGGYMAGEYLLNKGRKNIAIISGRTNVDGSYNAEQRIKGFTQALQSKGITLAPSNKFEVIHYSREDGIETMPKLLDIGVDAIFCAAGDNTATGLLSVARERGVRVPGDVAILGFDDLFVAQVSTPPLTTIKQPLKEMAEAAYKMAVFQKAEILQKPQRTIFKPEIVERQSV